MNEEERQQYFYLVGKNPEYDRIAKKLLANRKILSWILKYCVEEFRDSEISDIRDKYIQGTPEVAFTPVLPDETNAGKADNIQGDANEDVTVTEGQVTFDIRFRAISPSDELMELIINVEAQKNSHPGYPLLKRAMYYCSRLISSQHGVDFDKSHYEKIKKVYSIWLCMDVPGEESGITRYKMQEQTEYGDYREEMTHYDLQQVVMVYIGRSKRDAGNRMLNLLSELFKSDDSAAIKLRTLKENYDINLTQSEEGMVDTMCNLSVGVFERGIEHGIEKGIEQGEENKTRSFVINLLHAQMQLNFITSMAECTEKYVRQVAQEENLPIH